MDVEAMIMVIWVLARIINMNLLSQNKYNKNNR